MDQRCHRGRRARHGPNSTLSWARIINLSRRQHPNLETVQLDLTLPETYEAVKESFKRELAEFKGKRAIFIHNAYFPGNQVSFVSEHDEKDHALKIQANAVAPLILGDMFLRAVKPGYESAPGHDVVVSCAPPLPGQGAYCAAKASIEMWVRVVKRELALRGRDTWVVAVRPGFVDTPTTRANALVV